MAELILSALLPIVFEKLASAAVNKIARAKEIHLELKKWHRSLKQIQNVLNDASQKEVTEEAVKEWLNSLQHLAYDIDDVLDDMATEAMHREFTNESEASTSKLKKLIPTCCTSFSLSTTSMDGKVSDITTRLQQLVDEKKNLGLIVKDGRTKNKNRDYETSSIRETNIVGRDDDKEILLPKILGGELCRQNFSIVAIVGMGGMGKTTLARLLYNDKLVKDHFYHKAWVCISDDFDSFKISKEIFQSVSGETQKFESLDLLQKALEDRLMGKRFLIVLDDVWSDKLKDWETLAGPFYKGAPGSKIIITTRKKELLRLLDHVHSYDLQKLLDDDALSLFAQHAGLNDFDSYEAQREHAEGIVQKCGGLPLAIKALGSLLREKVDEEEWKDVLNNDIWKLEDKGGLVPALILSYQDLSARLKQLFAYCSLLPKDYVFKKEDLILKWMAEGFLHQSDTNTSMERLGDKCFQELLSKSFFQHVPGDDKSLFMMHDLMNDLATLVAGEFIIRLDIGMEKDDGEEVLKKYRHMSFVPEMFTTYNKLKSFKKANSLRTFLAVPIVVDKWQQFFVSSKILLDLLSSLPLLRVLCLSKLEIDEVPESVGNMKHLRYLNLSQNDITHLPDNVCNLYNLQTLIVSGCEKLTKLPDNFMNLKSLRHFDIRDTCLWNMLPPGIGELKGLQILSNIIVGENDNFPINGLSNLKNLQGKIYIRGLEQVKSATDIQKVKLSQKRVSGLKLEWRDLFDDSRNGTLENEVFSALMPHSDKLKDLSIESYGDKVFPNWIGDSKFVRLSRISVSRCRNCAFLPPLGSLPSLKKLFIKDLDEVKDVGSEFVGAGSGPAFPSLESLCFEDMRGWEAWSTTVGGGVGAVFPCLQELTLVNCPNLAVVSLDSLPSLRILEIKNCGDGVLRSMVHVAPSVTKLSITGISGLSDEVWRDVMGYLRAVEEVTIRKCNEIKYMWESEAEASKVFVNLRKLEVDKCSELVSLGEKEINDNSGCNNLTSLKILVLFGCKNLERFSCPDNIESLTIYSCESITCVSFPTGGCQKLKSLRIEFCNQLSEEELEKVLLITSTSMLEFVCINYWPNLKSVNELTKFIRLTELWIIECRSIESFPADVLPTFTSLKRLTIKGCKNMDVASFGLWPPNLGYLSIGGLKKPISQWGPQTFPTSLVHLILHGGSGEEDDVTSGTQLSHMLPKSLTRLYLIGFEKLETVSKGLQHLTSLQHLVIWYCPKMKDLPETLLPSLLSLVIRRCPDELKEKTSRRGSYWPLISYIPDVRIE